MKRRTFMKVTAAGLTAVNTPDIFASASTGTSATGKGEEALTVRFLGTGAADWNSPNAKGELRRFTSVLLEHHIMIDCTAHSHEMLDKASHPDILFYTHSHQDHYNPAAAIALGIKQIYVSHTWYDIARKEFAEAAAKMKAEMPVLMPVYPGQPVQADDLIITPVPANHITEKFFEQTLMYLVEKKEVRLLYATDTGGIPAMAARIAGIDAHQPGKPITALIMEATMGLGHEQDYRLFNHSSVADVKRTAEVLLQTGRYAPPTGQPVYITHMAKTLHGTQEELDRDLPAPIRAAYDGLEVLFTTSA